MAFHSVYKEYLVQHLPCLTQRGQSSDCVYVHVLGRGVRPAMGTLCVIGVLWQGNGSNGVRSFVCLFFNSSATGWRQQLEMVLPSQGCRELGLDCDRPKRGNNISVHSVCLCTDETDRGVDQQDGKNHERSPECEESDASKEEGLKMRLPTRSDMICGYACLRGIVSSKGEIQKVASLSDCGGSGCRRGPSSCVRVPRTFPVCSLLSWLQGPLPCATPSGAPGTWRPSLRCSVRGRVTSMWPTCSWR